ncbi:MAG: hypothetical protein IPO90_08595 [Flavobacteriales bacterium]|nr:hypothetical protein [Flavobacteriales bacterium]
MNFATYQTLPSLLFVLLGLFTQATTIAQVPEHELNFVERSNTWTWAPNIITDDYHVKLDILAYGKQKGMMVIEVVDNATGAEVGKSTFDPKWGEDHFIDKLIHHHGKVYVIYEVVDRKGGRVDVCAQEIALPQPAFTGERKLLATINFEPKGFSWGGKLYAKFYTSDNGAYTAFFFDAIRSKEDEQLVLVHMLDQNLNPLWQQGYQIPFDSEKITTVRVRVSDEGVVYALMNAGFKNKRITSKSVNYAYQVFGMAEKGMASQMIELGADLNVVTCDLVLRKGTTPVIGGFHVEEGTSTEITKGYFMGAIEPTLEQAPVIHTFPFTREVDERMVKTQMYTRSDGGTFLTGISRNSGGTSMSESYLFAASFDQAGEQEWGTMVPRALVASKSDEDAGYRSFCAKDKLMLLVPDKEENLANYTSRGELKKVRKGPYIPLVIGFAATGEASFAKFGAPANYSLWVSRLPLDMSISNATFAIPCSKKAGKKEISGMLFMDFK